MTKEEIAEVRALLGPAPILTTEDPECFEAFFIRLAMSMKPRDAVEVLLIWQFSIGSWLVNRYTRHAAVAIERRFQDSVRHQAQRLKIESTRRLQTQSAPGNSGPADIAAMIALEDKIDDFVSNVDEILLRKASERNHNVALERNIVFQEQLDRLTTSATRRRDDALAQLELYRNGLGVQAKEAADRVLDGEFHEVPSVSGAAPALVPSDQESVNDAEPTSTETDAA